MPEKEVRSNPRDIQLGVSACLLGQEVRHDGGHKQDIYLTQTLSQYFELIPVCPEVAIGLGIPRPPIRLKKKKLQVRVVGIRNPDLDVTNALADYGRVMAAEMAGISGYIFKNRSPSCGLERVPVYPEGTGAPNRSGTGEYARSFTEMQPLLPVEEEGRLRDPVLRENFFERVFVYHRWQQLAQCGLSASRLVDFHTCHKFLLLAHGQDAYRRLGRLVSRAGGEDLGQIADRYHAELMETLARRATRKSHANVLQHLQGYLKRDIDAEDKAELGGVIEQYRQGRIPLIVPITLLRHHFRKHPSRYARDQVYLDPHPSELMLRNLI